MCETDEHREATAEEKITCEEEEEDKMHPEAPLLSYEDGDHSADDDNNCTRTFAAVLQLLSYDDGNTCHPAGDDDNCNCTHFRRSSLVHPRTCN